MNKKTDLTCKNCRKVIGKLSTSGKAIKVQEGVTHYKDYFCGEDCYFLDWLNCWGNIQDHEECREDDKITTFGRGYKTAMLDVYQKFKVKRRVKKFVEERRTVE